MIEGPTPAVPEVPTRAGRIWRIVLIVVAVQASLVALGTVAFSALGVGDGPTCGGG